MSTDPRVEGLPPLPEPAGSIEVKTADYLDDKGKVVGYISVEHDGFTADQMNDHVRPLVAEISRLTAELEEARKDAGRYRWLRNGRGVNWDVLPVDKGTDIADWRCMFHSPYGMHDETEDSLDKAVDAAMTKDKP